jgi:predicted transcriptional regulator YdeE
MPVIEQQQTIQTLEILREEEIAAPIDVVFETLLEQMGPYNETPDKVPLPMKLEPWPGGRWFRDLGENTGHWWGNVQAIKAPTLLEICGPLFMSYPATSNVQYRLSEEDGITRLKFAHRAIGWMPAEMTEGVNRGWDNILMKLRERALKRNDRPRTTARGESHAASVNGFAPVRMEEGGQRTVVGLKGHFRFGGDPSIAALWTRFAPHLGKIPGQMGSVAYGVCWNLEDGGLEYMAGVEVRSEEDVPLELVEESIPPSTFAVFSHHGHVSEIPKTMGRVYEWLARNGREVRNDRDVPGLIERYGERFDPRSGSGDIELWVPVK